MPSFTLNEQDGNSCAAHCTVVAVAELTGVTNLDKDYAEDNLWPDIKFKPEGGNPVLKALSDAENSDPRRIVSEVKRRWPRVKSVMMCDDVQKNKALPFVHSNYRDGMGAMFNMLAGFGVKTQLKFDELAYYNCSYTMHDGAVPFQGNYSGMHNILVTFLGGKVYYYNSNESDPQWKITNNWQKLESQNNGDHSYVYTGVCVVLS